jgi:hypothetical protein
MPNYTTQSSYTLPTGPKALTPQEAGKAFGGIGRAVGEYVRGTNANEKEAKVQDLVSKYNGKFPPFGAENRSADTQKLAQLLLPLDRELSLKYSAKAGEEQGKEKEQSVNKGIASAFQSPFLAAKTQWESQGTTAEQLNAELARAEEDLKELLRRKEGLDQKPPMSLEGEPSPVAPTIDFSRYNLPGVPQ